MWACDKGCGSDFICPPPSFIPMHLSISIIGVPTIKVTKTSFMGDTLTVSFTHPDSYPKESAFRDQLKYEVVQKDKSKRFSEDTTTVWPSTKDSVKITGGLASSINVRVYYGNWR